MGRQPGSKTRLLCRQIRRFHIRRTGSWGYPGSIFASVFLLKEVENLKGVNSFMICQRRWLLKKFLLLSMKLPLVCELLMMTYFSGVCFEFEVKWSKRCVFVFVFFSCSCWCSWTRDGIGGMPGALTHTGIGPVLGIQSWREPGFREAERATMFWMIPAAWRTSDPLTRTVKMC